MQVKAGIELPHRFSCSSASGGTEAHSDCQKRPSTTCIRVSQGGSGRFGYHRSVKTQTRAGLSSPGTTENPSPASRSGSPRSVVAPHARRPLQTAFKRLQNGYSADARDSKSHYGILSPLNTSVLGLINAYHRMLSCASLSLRTPACHCPARTASLPGRSSRHTHVLTTEIRWRYGGRSSYPQRSSDARDFKIPLTCR